MRGVVVGETRAQKSSIILGRGVLDETVTAYCTWSRFLLAACGPFVFEDTLHNACGAQAGNNDDYTVTQFFSNGHGRRGDIDRMTNIQSIESHSMPNSNVRNIHLQLAQVFVLARMPDHHH